MAWSWEPSLYWILNLEQLSPSSEESLGSDVASAQHPAPHLQGSCLSHSSWKLPWGSESVDFLYFRFFASKTNMVIDFMWQHHWVSAQISPGAMLGRLWVMFLCCVVLGFEVASSMLLQ